MESHGHYRIVRYVLAAIALIAFEACVSGHHIRLNDPSTSQGQDWECKPSAKDGSQVCSTPDQATADELNQSGTVDYTLPKECNGRVFKIVISNAGKDDARVHVVCAQPEPPPPPPECPK
jgi:hypothetical protein